MKEAIDYEIQKKYTKAAECYEGEITNHLSDASPDCFINLAFLYWCFAFEFFEFVIPNNIPDHWSITGGERFLLVLDLGIQKFPNNIELHFWKKYFLHISYGEEFSERECLTLIEEYGEEENMVLYFFLYQFDKKKYKEQAYELLKQTEMTATAKNIYIRSVLT